MKFSHIDVTPDLAKSLVHGVRPLAGSSDFKNAGRIDMLMIGITKDAVEGHFYSVTSLRGSSMDRIHLIGVTDRDSLNYVAKHTSNLNEDLIVYATDSIEYMDAKLREEFFGELTEILSPHVMKVNFVGNRDLYEGLKDSYLHRWQMAENIYTRAPSLGTSLPFKNLISNFPITQHPEMTADPESWKQHIKTNIEKLIDAETIDISFGDSLALMEPNFVLELKQYAIDYAQSKQRKVRILMTPELVSIIFRATID